jgi:hypothetical protein
LGKPLGLCSNFSQTRIMRVALYPFATTAIGGLVQTYSRFGVSKEILLKKWTKSGARIALNFSERKEVTSRPEALAWVTKRLCNYVT